MGSHRELSRIAGRAQFHAGLLASVRGRCRRRYRRTHRLRSLPTKAFSSSITTSAIRSPPVSICSCRGKPWTDFNADYGSGFVDGEGPEHLPSHTTFDLSLGKSFGENWNVRVSGLNLSNHRYLLDNSNTFGGTHFVNPREISVQVKYQIPLLKSREFFIRSHVRGRWHRCGCGRLAAQLSSLAEPILPLRSRRRRWHVRGVSLFRVTHCRGSGCSD